VATWQTELAGILAERYTNSPDKFPLSHQSVRLGYQQNGAPCKRKMTPPRVVVYFRAVLTSLDAELLHTVLFHSDSTCEPPASGTKSFKGAASREALFCQNNWRMAGLRHREATSTTVRAGTKRLWRRVH
jgi:hypothetical protein